jgi:hypothetical protein
MGEPTKYVQNCGITVNVHISILYITSSVFRLCFTKGSLLKFRRAFTICISHFIFLHNLTCLFHPLPSQLHGHYSKFRSSVDKLLYRDMKPDRCIGCRRNVSGIDKKKKGMLIKMIIIKCIIMNSGQYPRLNYNSKCQ